MKKREDQWVDTSFLLRIGNKIPMKGVTETKFGAKSKGWTIVVPPIGLQTPSVPWVLSLASPLEALCVIQ